MTKHYNILGQSEGGASCPRDNNFDRYPYMKHSTAAPQGEPQTKPKLTFEEWWHTIGVLGYGKLFEKPQCEGIWNAAQENM